MDIQTTTARLRRTFAYPNDDTCASDTAEPELDEQEQEALIEMLATQNAERNHQFRLFLLALPVLSTLPYLISLLDSQGGRGRADDFMALLAVTSLASTAWMLWSLPPGVTGIPVLDRWVSGDDEEAASGGGRRRGLWQSDRLRERVQHKSPLETYLPYMNMGLCLVLMVTGLLSKVHAPQRWGHVGLGNLPAVVYVVVLVTKVVMGGVDPERELAELKYGYKGA